MLPGIVGLHAVIGATANPPPAGTPPAFIEDAGLVGNAGTEAVNVPYPASVPANSIAILQAIMYDTLNPNTLNIPSGFSEIDLGGVFSSGDANSHMGLYWKRCTGSEGGTTVNITSTAGHASTDTLAGIISIWSDCITSGTPYEGVASGNANNTSMVGSAVTTLGNNRRVCHFGATWDSTTGSPSAGYTENYDAQTGSGTFDGAVFCYSKSVPSAGSVSSATHTLAASRRWRTVALALIPA